MSAQVETMPRRPASFRIDERVLEVIATLATRSGMEPQRYLETYFFARGKELGLIPPDAQLLGETRGGKRAGAGKPKKSLLPDQLPDQPLPPQLPDQRPAPIPQSEEDN